MADEKSAKELSDNELRDAAGGDINWWTSTTSYLGTVYKHKGCGGNILWKIVERGQIPAIILARSVESYVCETCGETWSYDDSSKSDFDDTRPF